MPSSRRVALLCQHFYPEMISTGMHMTELATSLRELGWQVTVFCAQPTLALDSHQRVPRRMEHRGIEIIRVASCGSHSGGLLGRLLFAVTYLLGTLWKVIRHHRQFDGLLITTNPPFLGLVGRLARAMFRLPYVLIVYDVYPDIVVRLGVFKPKSLVVRVWHRLTRLIMNGAAANVVIGRDMAAIIAEKLDQSRAERIHLIPNWSDDRVVRPVAPQENRFRREHNPLDCVLVQYSGRMGTTHNLEPLVEAAELLRGQPILFQFIGDGAKKRKLEAMVRQKQLTNVQFLPYQPLENLCEVLSAADLAVVCLESIFTGLSVPSKAYGVMASSVPMLGFLDPDSEIGRTITEHDCGVILADPTGAQVAAAIGQLVVQPGRLRAMGANGYNAFKADYTLLKAGQRYSELMTRSFADGGSARAA